MDWVWVLFCAAACPGPMGAAPAFSPGPISADGRYVAFSTDQDLLPIDQNNLEDVYRYDCRTGDLLLISINTDNSGSGDADSHSPAISADGEVVAFVSNSTNLSPLDHNGFTDVFLRDLAGGATTLISVNRFGTNGGNDRSVRMKLSADGGTVVFDSRATDLVELADGNASSSDVFVRDWTAGVTTLVSVNQAGDASGDRGSTLGGISSDGSVVVFGSSASDLAANDTNTFRDVFVRHLASGVTTLVSANQAATGGGNADSTDPAVSASGEIVAFASSASDLVTGDANGESDIFVHNLSLGVTTLVSLNRKCTSSGNGGSFGLNLSADGKTVAFASAASDLVAGDENGNIDVFARNLETEVTTLISGSLTGSGSANGRSEAPVLSANGAVVAFVSTANDLTSEPVDGLLNLFVQDLAAGTRELASVNQSGQGSGNESGFFHDPMLSSNGRLLLFQSLATDLIATNIAGCGVFLFSPAPRLLIGQAGSGGLPRPNILLSYPSDVLAVVEFSLDLLIWAPLSALANVSLSTDSAGGTTRTLLTLHEGAPLHLFFRLAPPYP